ncbi:MAG: isoprenyl transferase [Aerococcus sp.]|nr:isoprenyl transferase [Aerococcus sp.]
MREYNPQGIIPEHVAIIMDGNGRWATARQLKRTEGHREGLQAVRRVTTTAANMGIKILTLYAFSTENWKRPVSEVRFLMSLPKYMEDEVLPELIENNVRVQMMGFTENIPKSTLDSIRRAESLTKSNDGLLLNIAFNYGSRAEIVHAVQTISQEVATDKLSVDEIDEKTIDDRLMTAALGPKSNPDFLIRSSGEVRLSNFLLWQLAYAEMYFTDVLWPDFDQEVFENCIGEFQHRQRRYGGLSE